MPQSPGRMLFEKTKMDQQIIQQEKHRLRLQFNASKTFTPEQKHKVQQAIDQYMLKTKEQRKKLENRIKRIINQTE